MSTETVRTSSTITNLQASTGSSSNYLSDQLIAAFGSSRRSEILGFLGDDGRPFESQINSWSSVITALETEAGQRLVTESGEFLIQQ